MSVVLWTAADDGRGVGGGGGVPEGGVGKGGSGGGGVGRSLCVERHEVQIY